MKIAAFQLNSVALTSLLLLDSLSFVAAQGTIVVGSQSGKEIVPFGISAEGTAFYTGQYQQVYSAAAFPGRVLISAIAFSQDVRDAQVASLDISIGLATTTKTPDAPGTSFETGSTTVFSGVLMPLFTPESDDFDFVVNLATPYWYDPVQGNLLLDVMVFSGTGDNSGYALSLESNMGALWTVEGLVNATPHRGLVTEFTIVPEPSVLALLGLGGLCLFARAHSLKGSSEKSS